MTDIQYYPAQDAEPSPDGDLDVGLWYDTENDIGYRIIVPQMSDEMADTFFESIEDYFYRQGGYLRRCIYCGDLFPFFPFGISYRHCDKAECLQEAYKKSTECAAHMREKKEQAAEKARVKADSTRIEREERQRVKAERQREQEVSRGHPGFVYLMKSDTGLHKIGCAKDINARRAGIERDTPVAMEIIHYFSSSEQFKAEKVLHLRYAEQRVKYEWFDLSPEQIEDIKSIPDHGLDDLL
ncbi:MAG TPA: GIY-YIG nuclease family protein [Bellilinea sp.]|nr:GIY-YIG nuclease family protein [Bellilinea sp.]